MGKRAVKNIYFELQCQWSNTKSNSFKHKKQNKLKKNHQVSIDQHEYSTVCLLSYMSM